MWRICRIFVCKITKSQVILKTRAIKLLIISSMNDSSSEFSKSLPHDAAALVEKYRLYLLLEQGLSETLEWLINAMWSVSWNISQR